MAGATVSLFVTFVTPAISCAFAAIAVLSSSVRTGPFNVTMPSRVMIFMLWAYVESDLSSINALRIFLVVARSAGFIFCWSAVAAPAFASRNSSVTRQDGARRPSST